MKHRILVAIIVPVILICGVFSYFLTHLLTPPIESILKNQADAVLVHASDLGLIVCEERVADLIDGHLFDDDRVVKTFQRETVEQIKKIGPKFPGVDMVIVDDSGAVILAPTTASTTPVDASVFREVATAPVALELFGKQVIAHYRYFPFWRWNIISVIDEEVYRSPIVIFKRIIAIGTFGVSVVSVGAILVLFVLRVNRPLTEIIEATKRIAKGERAFIDVRNQKNEIAQVALAINAMEGRLAEDKERIRASITKLAEYKKALESSGDVIYAVGRDYRYLFVNRTFLEYHKTELIEVEHERLDRVFDKSLYESTICPQLEKSMAGESVAFEMSYPYRGAGLRSVFASYSPIINTDGNVSGVIAVIRDITDRKNAEESLRRLNEDLELRVTQRTAELERSNENYRQALEKLQQAQSNLVRSEKLAALGSLVAGVAHELSTPLGTSVTVVSTLAERLAELDARANDGNLDHGEVHRFLALAIEASELLTRTLRQSTELIQNFKQVAVDQTSAQRRRFDLAVVIGEVVATLQPLFKHSRQKIEVAVPENLWLDSYPGPLGQVVTNLVRNAKLHAFTDDSAGEVRISALALSDDRVRLTVEDNGRGIPAEHLNRIFDPFFTTRMGQGGSGLGLHIVYNIATGVLGGRIDVSSRVGDGTRFELDLPSRAPLSDGQETRRPDG